jgi:LacI family transcriptional regulator
MVSEMIDWKIPLVVLNRDVDAARLRRVDRVTSDNVRGGRLVAAPCSNWGTGGSG